MRMTTARPQRSRADWARKVAHLMDTRYAKCETITLVNEVEDARIRLTKLYSKTKT